LSLHSSFLLHFSWTPGLCCYFCPSSRALCCPIRSLYGVLRLLRRFPGRKQFLRRYLGYDFRPPSIHTCPSLHGSHTPHTHRTYTSSTQMRRPPAKLCADCVPCAVRRSHGTRVAPLPRSIANEKSLGLRPMAYSTLTRLPQRTGLQSSVPTNLITVPVNTSLLQKRGLATAAEGVAPSEALSETKVSGAPQDGPMREYDIRVQEGRLRDDSYQRGKQGINTQP
jgi:hypothetical protein